MLSKNRALANASFMAAVAARAAKAVHADHVLVLTNARWERVARFRQTIAAHGVGATLRTCTDAPPVGGPRAPLVVTGSSVQMRHEYGQFCSTAATPSAS